MAQDCSPPSPSATREKRRDKEERGEVHILVSCLLPPWRICGTVGSKRKLETYNLPPFQSHLFWIPPLVFSAASSHLFFFPRSPPFRSWPWCTPSSSVPSFGMHSISPRKAAAEGGEREAIPLSGATHSRCALLVLRSYYSNTTRCCTKKSLPPSKAVRLPSLKPVPLFLLQGSAYLTD